MPTDDMELVREYAAHRSESAFATLVSRHTNLVYSAALRQVRDPQLAAEVTQVVFVLLARKAGSLAAETVLPGWLYRTAAFVSKSALKRELRRQRREQEVYMQSVLHEKPDDASWEQMAPLLDEAMLQLGQAERDALVLRFFEERTLGEVGSALGASEEAAKKRVNRALEKLRRYFLKRGIASTTVLIAAALSAHSVCAAPAGLTTIITTTAASEGAVAGASTLTLTKGALKLMAWTKMKTAAVTAAAVLLATGTATVAWKGVEAHHDAISVHQPWTDAGAATPEAALQTFLWSLSTGDTNRLSAIFFWNTLGPDSPRLHEIMRMHEQTSMPMWATNIESFRLTSKEPLGADGLWLHLAGKTRNGRSFRSQASVYVIDGAWHITAHASAGLPNDAVEVTLPFAPEYR